MRSVLSTVSLAFAVLTSRFMAAPLAAAQPGAPRPHIVYIMADDLGWKDVGFHGSDFKTPNLDKLPQEGARLAQFYAQPMCTPSRASLMTGRYPFRYGLQTAVIPSASKYGLATDEWLLPQALQEVGYKTAIVGKWHLGHADRKYWPRQRGFDYQYGAMLGEIDYFTDSAHGKTDWYRNNQLVKERGYATQLLGNDAMYAGMPVTFTGHSLGGRLAALMAVYFDKPAITFNAAPFLRHADSLAVVTQLKVGLLAAGYSVPGALADYVAVDPTGALLPSPSRLLRDDQVRHIYVEGEVLSVAPSQLLSAIWLVNSLVPTGKIIGTDLSLDPQAQTTATWGFVDRAFDLHPQALLTGFLASTPFLAAARESPALCDTP